MRLASLMLACAIGLGAPTMAARNGPDRQEWTHYKNARWGFCVDYPAAWRASEPSDGSGVTLYPKNGADSKSDPYISITGVPDQPDFDNSNVVLDDSPPMDLEGNLARVLGNLRDYDHASDIRVLEKRKLTFQGFDALSTNVRYRTSTSGGDWTDETLWINDEYIIFAATVFGRPDEVSKLEPVYQEIVKRRFRLECNEKRPRPSK